MSWLSKASKSVSKAVKNVTKTASKAVKDTGNVVVKAHVDAGKTLQLDKALQYGAPVAATFLGGPAAGAVVTSGTQGGDMDLFGSIGSYFGLDPALTKLAAGVASGLGPKPKPVPSQSEATYVAAPVAPPKENNLLKYGLIGGGALALVAILVVALKGKGK